MTEAIRPEVVGHFDLPRLFSNGHPVHGDPSVRAAQDEALTVIAEADALLEVNTSGYRKGLEGPYPEAGVIRRALELGVPFTLSDDSHHVDHVGAHLEETREYLLGAGVRSIACLGRASDGALEPREIVL
jgi:histidinol-phosphatase (PHP family)